MIKMLAFVLLACWYSIIHSSEIIASRGLRILEILAQFASKMINEIWDMGLTVNIFQVYR